MVRRVRLTGCSKSKGMRKGILFLWMLLTLSVYGQQISQEEMQRIYQEVRTPYKYGMVVAPTDNYHKID